MAPDLAGKADPCEADLRPQRLVRERALWGWGWGWEWQLRPPKAAALPSSLSVSVALGKSLSLPEFCFLILKVGVCSRSGNTWHRCLYPLPLLAHGRRSSSSQTPCDPQKVPDMFSDTPVLALGVSSLGAQSVEQPGLA